MTTSRALGIASAVTGAIGVVIGPLGNLGLPPKWGAALGLVSLAINAFTERIQGSPDYRRRKRLEKERREGAMRE